VFERFYRIMGTEPEGSGLGLWIVQQIVTASFQLEELRLERLAHPLLAARRPRLYLNE